MTPQEYLKSYTELKVPIVSDDAVTRWETVNVHKYVLIVSRNQDGSVVWDGDHPNNQNAWDAMWGKLRDHFAKKDATLAVYVGSDSDSQRVEFKGGWGDVWYYARKTFIGKGSAADVQITLQLANRFNLLQGGDLQSYADKFVGLDCNGFVGNYLVHGLAPDKGAWNAEPPGTDYLANTDIKNIVTTRGARVQKLDDLVAANMYLMAMVDDNTNQIIPGGGGSPGHLFITEPNLRNETAFTDARRITRNVVTMRAVESAGGVGLIAADCQFLGVQDGIFTIRRLSVPNMAALSFQAFRVK